MRVPEAKAKREREREKESVYPRIMFENPSVPAPSRLRESSLRSVAGLQRPEFFEEEPVKPVKAKSRKKEVKRPAETAGLFSAKAASLSIAVSRRHAGTCKKTDAPSLSPSLDAERERE